MKKIVLLLFFSAALLAAAENRYRPVIRAVRVRSLPFSAALTAKEWQRAPAYPFYKCAWTLQDYHRLPCEKAEVKLLYDDKFLYVGAKAQDTEIVSTGTENQSHLYALGDVIEVFIKPEKEKYYWEIYGSPQKLYSCFYFRSRGLLSLAEPFKAAQVKIKVDTVLCGTLNNWRDRDKGWNVLIAIPLAELRKNGLKFTNEENWTILIARYNYSRYLAEFELSTAPQNIPNFHCYENYARLEIDTEK